MRELIRKVPIPTAGVALGLAALGNLLKPLLDPFHHVFGLIALLLIGLLTAKVILFPSLIREDLRNSVLASVSATFFMTLMQIATYLASFALGAAFALWVAAVIGHLVLIGWFTLTFIRRFKLPEVFPTYFICYVGIIVASATAPAFGAQRIGYGLFWLGFACYLVLLVVVTYRYAKHEVPEGARPLFCIYTAPMSLSLVGYLACAPAPNMLFVGILFVAAQLLYVIVLTRLPKFLALDFYPSFAAMTFPFVITATALGQVTELFRAAAMPFVTALEWLALGETMVACLMVAFVLGHYVRFLFARPRTVEVEAEAEA